jgi:PadR family transcriptional regulator PadR
MNMSAFLGTFEHALLYALLHLGDEAYTVTIGRALATRTGRRVSPGAVDTPLARLERRGLVSSRFGEPTPERGGKRKRFYRLSAAGRRALRESEQALARLSAGLAPELEAP